MLRLVRPHLRATMLALVTFAALGCRTPPSKIPIDELESEDQGEAEGEASATVEPLAVERPTDMLPAEVAVMAEAIDPAAVLGLLGPLDKYPELSSMRAQLRSELGGDIFDPEQWDELGLDSHGPAGLAVLDVGAEAFCAYLSLVDEDVFGQTVERVADKIGAREQFGRTEVGDARVYRLGEELSVVVRAKVAMIVFVDDPEDAARDFVVSAAMIDPRESLGHAERFEWARAQVEDADDGMLFVDPGALLDAIERAESGGSHDYGVRYAEEELARARSAGEPPERIRELEQRIEEERRWQRERQDRDAARRDMVRSFLGPVGAFMGAADLRDDGIVAHGRLLIPGDGLLRRMLLAPEHESPLLTALDEPPVFALDGRVDMQALLEAVDLLARADGESLTDINADIRAELGVDVLGEIIPALSGEGGFAITQERAPDPAKLDELPKTLGLAAHVGLKDPEAIRELLDNVARNKLMSGVLVRARRGDGWILKVPNWHDVELELVGQRLVFATDTKLDKRIRDAEAGGQAQALAAAEHPFRGPLTAPAMRLYARWSGAVALDRHQPFEQDAEALLYDYNSHHTLTPDEAAKVPRSREYKKKLAELEKAVDELNEYSRRRASREFEELLEFTTRLGDAGLQVETSTDGLGLRAQWRFAAGTTPLELGMLWIMAVRGHEDDWAEYDRIWSSVYALTEELRQIRQADLDAAAAKRK